MHQNINIFCTSRMCVCVYVSSYSILSLAIKVWLSFLSQECWGTWGKITLTLTHIMKTQIWGAMCLMKKSVVPALFSLHVDIKHGSTLDVLNHAHQTYFFTQILCQAIIIIRIAFGSIFHFKRTFIFDLFHLMTYKSNLRQLVYFNICSMVLNLTNIHAEKGFG